MSALDQSNWANNQQEVFNEEYADNGFGPITNNSFLAPTDTNQEELI